MWQATLRFCIALLLAACGIALAQPYPYKPIRIIVPYPPGSGTEFTAREVAQLYTKALGQQGQALARPHYVFARCAGNLAGVPQPGDIGARWRIFLEELLHTAMDGARQ